MTATIRPIGMLKQYIGDQKFATIDSGISIRQALISLGILPELVALALVNEKIQSKDYVLQDNDDVQLVAVLGGG